MDSRSEEKIDNRIPIREAAMSLAPERLTRDQQLDEAREHLRRLIDEYITAEAEVRALEEGAFRVVIFGSARIGPRDAVYQMVYRIARALAEQGIDIVTGGGPGLMEAANRAVHDAMTGESRSIGLPILLPALEEPANKHLDIKSNHRRFSSRLDEFMRLSNAVIVAPGGIGTMLELFYVWQLLQVGLTNDRPVILLRREMWGGLLRWMHESLLAHGYISASDFRWIRLVDTEQEVIELISRAHRRFRDERAKRPHEESGIDQTVTDELLAAMPMPTELSEEATPLPASDPARQDDE